MARKFGKITKMSEKFEDYSYIINGVGGIGKTTLVYEIGKIITGSDEGTFIITCGGENKPKHIPGAFGDVAPDFKTFKEIVKELCDNKKEYPNTRFVAIDSLDEYARIVENAVVAEWNASCDISDRAKSISTAYKGFQKGENRACDLMIQQIVKLQDAGYSIIEIGHTKTKTREDVITKVQFEQLTCNLDNKYYNALKDKVNLVAMCYWENVIENIEEKKNAFTKKMNKVGELADRKRVMVFADDDNAIDTKTHFEYITHKIDLSAQGFIDAVEEAIALKLSGGSEPAEKKPVDKKKPAPVVEESEADDDLSDIAPDDDIPFDEDDILDEEPVKEEPKLITMTADRLKKIRDANRTASDSVKKQVKSHLVAYGNKLSNEMYDTDVNAIEELLGIE